MLVKEVLGRRDKLKNYAYGLQRSINYFRNTLGDQELAEDLEELYQEIQKEFHEIDKALATFENMEM